MHTPSFLSTAWLRTWQYPHEINLLRYLSDRRPKIRGALESLNITSADSHKYPFLSETSVQDLLSLPDSPLADLSTEQLIRFAQIVDTALFKSSLVIRPKLLGPLCRLDNWCEVSEVEEVLLSREASFLAYRRICFLPFSFAEISWTNVSLQW